MKRLSQNVTQQRTASHSDTDIAAWASSTVIIVVHVYQPRLPTPLLIALHGPP